MVGDAQRPGRLAEGLALAEVQPGDGLEPGFLEVPVLGKVYRWYFDHVMPLVGNLLSGTDYAYTYLSETVYAFPSDEGFVRSLQAAGFADTGVILLSYGIARIYRARKPAAKPTDRARR